MKAMILSVLLAGAGWGLSSVVAAEPVPARPAGPGMESAATSSQQDLDASIKELAALRAQIESEKLPLARELTALEERLVDLRGQRDSIARNLDTGSLDAGVRQGELKLRQEEFSYVANLLDEYTRNLETRLHVSEVQRYGALLQTAKEAPSDSDLTSAQKRERQLEVVRVSLGRLQELVGGTQFEGTAVDPQGEIATGTFALVGPVALFASSDGRTAGLALPQSGSNQPAVRPLEPAFMPGLAAVVNTGAGLLPLDPSRGAALKELIQRTSLIHIFEKGGPIMWPLLAVSILALATVIERIFFIANERRKRDMRGLSALLSAVENGDIERAVRIGETSKYFAVRALGWALGHRERSLSSALLYANARELKRFSRGLPILDTAITISPLLGLLGTVTGMMSSFALIGGELSAPAAITGGIAEALIATAFGLGIAIVALIPFNYLSNRVEEIRHELEAAAAQLELLLQQPNPAPPVHLGAAGPAVLSAATAAGPAA